MKTVQCSFTTETTLLIPGIKGKLNRSNKITHKKTEIELNTLIKSFVNLITGLQIIHFYLEFFFVIYRRTNSAN